MFVQATALTVESTPEPLRRSLVLPVMSQPEGVCLTPPPPPPVVHKPIRTSTSGPPPWRRICFYVV